MPIFFVTLTSDPYEFNKTYLLFFLACLALIIWLAKMVFFDRELRFRRTVLDLPIFAFLGVAVLSALFSVDHPSSIFGYFGRFGDGLIGLIPLIILYYLVINGEITIKGVLRSFLASSFVVVLMSYFAIFGVWQGINDGLVKLPQQMLDSSFNPVSAVSGGLAMFLSVVLSLTVGLFLSEEKKLWRGIPLIVLFLAVLGLLIMIDYDPSWFVILATFLFFCLFGLWKRVFQENVNRLMVPIFLIIISTLFLVPSISFRNIQYSSEATLTNRILSIQPERTLDASANLSITQGALTENVKSIFLGSGIGTFNYSFNKFKPIEFNQENIWNVDFIRSSSNILEVLITMGILGLISYSLLIGFAFLIFWFLFKNKGEFSFVLPLILTFTALVFGQLVYYQSMISAFLFWLFLALLMVAQGSFKEKVVSFRNFQELALVFNIILVVLVLTVGFFYLSTFKFYLAEINYTEALTKSQNNQEIIKKLEKVVGLNPFYPQYKISLSQAYFGQAILDLTSGSTDILRINNYITNAIAYAKGETKERIQVADEENITTAQKENRAYVLDENGYYRMDQNNIPITIKVKGAVELSPNSAAAWENLGVIYREIQGISNYALDWAIKSFEKVKELKPTDPKIHTELGKLYLIAGRNDDAKKQFDRAIEVKNDYPDVLIQEALVYEREGNFEEAVKKMKALSDRYPDYLELYFQLGRLYYNNNQINEAIEVFKNIINLVPNHANAQYSLGVAYLKQGEKNLALQCFEKVLELNPDNEDVKNKIEELKKTEETAEEIEVEEKIEF